MPRTRRTYTPEFKTETVKLVTEQGYSVAEAVWEGDDSLATLLVQAIRGNVVPAWHAIRPFLRKTSALGRV